MFSAEIESVSRSNQQQQDWDGNASNAELVCCGAYRYCRESKRSCADEVCHLGLTRRKPEEFLQQQRCH